MDGRTDGRVMGIGNEFCVCMLLFDLCADGWCECEARCECRESQKKDGHEKRAYIQPLQRKLVKRELSTDQTTCSLDEISNGWQSDRWHPTEEEKKYQVIVKPIKNWCTHEWNFWWWWQVVASDFPDTWTFYRLRRSTYLTFDMDPHEILLRWWRMDVSGRNH